MPLAAEHVEPTQLAHPLALVAADLVELLAQASEFLLPLLRRQVEPARRSLVLRQELGVATEDDVDATASHVRSDRDPRQPTGLGDDLGLPEVLLGVQD